MSIYGTEHYIGINDDGFKDEFHHVAVQLVSSHIRHEGPGWEWLPPNRTDITEKQAEEEGYLHPRAVFFIADWTEKGTARNGQEYVNPLLMLTGEEYEKIPFRELIGRLEDAIQEHLLGETTKP